jgi:hypothetical protein
MAHAPSSKYIVMNKGMALYNEAKDDGSLHYLSYNDVSAFVDLVYSNDGNAPENEYDVTLIFLGMDESNTLNSVAFWALDVTAKRGPLKEKYEAFQKGKMRFI